MAGEASRWVSYDEAAVLFGIPAEAVKRLALRRSWPRRPGPGGGMLVAVPEAIPGDAADDLDPDDVVVVADGGDTQPVVRGGPDPDERWPLP